MIRITILESGGREQATGYLRWSPCAAPITVTPSTDDLTLSHCLNVRPLFFGVESTNNIILPITWDRRVESGRSSVIELNNLSVEEMKELQEYQLLEVLQQIVGEINVKRVQQMSFADGYSKYRTLSAEIKYLNDLKSGVQSLLRNFRDLAH